MRKLTINGHKIPCSICGRNAKHIVNDGLGIGVYCDRHYKIAMWFAEIVEFCTSMSDEYQIYRDAQACGYAGVMNGIYDPLSHVKNISKEGKGYDY